MEGKLFGQNSKCLRVSEDGTFQSLATSDPNSLPALVPGLVDIQVNGFAGVDFNSETISFDQYVHAGKALFQEHITAYLPTLVTNYANFLTERLTLLESYRERVEELRIPEIASAAGYHLEGPFISPSEGYRGAHPLPCVLATDAPEAETVVKAWQEAARGRIEIMTLSPHGAGVSDLIHLLKQLGIRVSLGHTDATAAQLHAAALDGAVLATHLGNACAQLLPRHANPIWSVLADDALWVSMIGDGFHLPPDMLKVFWSAKGNRTILVSDATQYAGMTPGCYHTHIGGDVVLTPEKKLHLAGQPNVLAGAAKSLFDGWKNLVQLNFGTPSAVWGLGSMNPVRFLAGTDFLPKWNPLLKLEDFGR